MNKQQDFTYGYPQFWFNTRINMMKILLDRAMKECKKKKLTVLSIGPGTGNEIYLARNYGKLTVLDLNQNVLDRVPNDLVDAKICSDVTNLPFKNSSFDIVMAFDVLEHVKDDNIAVLQINRVLKKGGIFIGSVPSYQRLFGSHDKYWGHYRRYENKEIKELLSCFKNAKIEYWNSLLFIPISIFRLLQKNSKANAHDKDPIMPIDILLRTILEFENYTIKKGHSYKHGLTTIWKATKA